jgi:hypothetical protein
MLPWSLRQVSLAESAKGEKVAIKSTMTTVARLEDPDGVAAELDIMERCTPGGDMQHPALVDVQEVLVTERANHFVLPAYQCDLMDLAMAHNDKHGTGLPEAFVRYGWAPPGWHIACCLPRVAACQYSDV